MSISAFAEDPPITSIKHIGITGDTIPPYHIKYVLKVFLKRHGLDTSLLEDVTIPSLEQGKEVTLHIPLSKEEKIWNVTVKAYPSIPIPCSFLAFSNHPERIKKAGLLFQCGLICFKPVRLRYYHLGDSEKPIRVSIVLKNPSFKKAKVSVVDASSGPSKNIIATGHMNNVKFMYRREKNMGWIEEVPPEGMIIFKSFILHKGEVISGTADFTLLEGGPLQILIVAQKDSKDEISYILQNDKKDSHARGAYPLTHIIIHISYNVGEELSLNIADTPLKNMFAGKKIKGNYGVMYQYVFKLRNEENKKAKISFLFQPRGGIATGTFWVGGKIISVGLTKPYQVVRLFEVKLPPHSSQNITVKTMPEDASNYPVRIILVPSVE